MGHNVSSINGVKSDNFYEQGNGINEIWVDDLEVISRLPFGDSDLGQAGWPAGNWPKIPWHQFIIPLKRDLPSIGNINSTDKTFTMTDTTTCCPCLKTYPEVGYFGMYKNWDPLAAGIFGGTLTCLGIYIMVHLIVLLKWNEVIMGLHGFMPDNPDAGAAPKEPPICAASWHALKPWLWRYCLCRLTILVIAIVFVVCGLPGGMKGMKYGSGPEVFFELLKDIAIFMGAHAGVQFLKNMCCLYRWRRSVRNDAVSLRNLEQHPGFEMRIETSGDPRPTVIQAMEIEDPKVEEA